MKIALILFALAACAGCAGPQVSPEQLATITKENHAAVGCATATGPWGRGGVVYVNAEHASVAAGKLTVNTDCSVSIEATK